MTVPTLVLIPSVITTEETWKTCRFITYKAWGLCSTAQGVGPHSKVMGTERARTHGWVLPLLGPRTGAEGFWAHSLLMRMKRVVM